MANLWKSAAHSVTVLQFAHLQFKLFPVFVLRAEFWVQGPVVQN